MKSRTVAWKPIEYQGMEYLTLREQGQHIFIDSVVLAVEDQSAFRLDYHLQCDSNFAIRSVTLEIAGRPKLQLTADGRGNWFDVQRQPMPEFQGCIDIDIAATPFTNTLPINRVKWQPGQSEIFSMVYIWIPELTVNVEKQRYTCLEKSADGGIYRFEQLSTGFTAVLPVDQNGLVLDYPELFSRVWSA